MTLSVFGNPSSFVHLQELMSYPGMLTLWTFKSGGPDLKFGPKNFLNPVDGLKIRI